MSATTDLNSRYRPYSISDVRRSAERQLFTVASTFAGGGGSSTGYKLAGGNILVANEIDPVAVTSYTANYPETPVASVDIRKITRSGGREGVLNFFNEYGVRVGELDIFDGSLRIPG